MLAACEMSGRVRDAFAARGWESWSADLLPSQTPVFEEYYGGPEFEETPSPEDCTPGGYHYQGDVRDLFDRYHPVNARRQEYKDYLDHPVWDLVIAFPPCTHLGIAGARYWKQKQQMRWNGIEWIPSLQQEGADFFMEMVNAPAPYVAVENPVGIMGRKPRPKEGVYPLYRVPDQVVQPYMFGDPLIKKTCLWLKGLPLLRATAFTLAEEQELMRVATGGGSYRADKARTGKANNNWEDQFGREFRAIMRSLTPPGLAQAMASQWGAYIEGRAA